MREGDKNLQTRKRSSSSEEEKLPPPKQFSIDTNKLNEEIQTNEVKMPSSVKELSTLA